MPEDTQKFSALSIKCTILCALSFLLFSCSGVVIHTTSPVALNVNAKIAVASFENKTQMSLAGEQVKFVAAKTLTSRGFRYITIAPPNLKAPAIAFKTQLQWAKRAGARYMVIGRVSQWNRILCLNCEPLVGVTVQLIDVPSGHTIWTADGSKSGEPKLVINKLIEELINAMLVELYPSAYTSGC